MPKRKLEIEKQSFESIGEEERWICTRCTLQNPSRRRRCEACESHRPVAELSRSDNTSAASTLNSNSSTSSSIVATWLRKRRRRTYQCVNDNQPSRDEPLACDAKQCSSKQDHEEAAKSKISSHLSPKTHTCIENLGIELAVPEDIEQSLTETSRNVHEAGFLVRTQHQATEPSLFMKESGKDSNSDFGLCTEKASKEERHVTENGGVDSKHLASAAESQCVKEDGKKGLSYAVKQCLKALNVADSVVQHDDTCEKENICDNDKGNHKQNHLLHSHGKATTEKPTKTPKFVEKVATENKVEFFYTPASQSQRDEYDAGKPVARTSSHRNTRSSEETLQSYDSMQNHSSFQGSGLLTPHQQEVCHESIPADNTSVLIHGVKNDQDEALLPEINAPLVTSVDEVDVVFEGNEQGLNVTTMLPSGKSSLHSASSTLDFHLSSESETNFVALATAGSLTVSKLRKQVFDTEQTIDSCGLSFSSVPLPAGKRLLLNAVSTVGVDDAVELPKQSREGTRRSSCTVCLSSSPTGQEKSVRSCTECGSADKESRVGIELTKELLGPDVKHLLAPCSTVEVFAESRVAFSSFATAGSGSIVEVSAEALKKGSALFTGDLTVLPHVSSDNTVAAKSDDCVSFTTAGSGSLVKVSEEAMKKGNTLFSGNLVSFSIPSSNQLTFSKSSALPSFATAGSGSLVKVSDEAIKKGNALFNGDSSALLETPVDVTLSVKSVACAPFATAGSGSIVEVSDERIKKGTALFSGNLGSSLIPSSNQLASSKSSALPSFATDGSGSLVKVSEEVLKKVHAFFIGNSIPSPNLSSNQPTLSKPSTYVSIASAGSDSINMVPAESLKKGNALVCEGSNAVPNLSFGAIDSATNDALASFATAGSGAIVQVSDEALERVNALFVGDSCSSLNPALNQQVTSYRAFATAGSGSLVDESEEASKKGNALFCEELNELSLLSASTSVSAKNNAKVSFSTGGSGAVVQASENAIRKAGAFCDEDSRSPPIPSSDNAGSSMSSPFAAFATAGSGSIVKVSEGALKHAKNILAGNVGQIVASPPVEQYSPSLALDSTSFFQNATNRIASDKMTYQSISSVPEGISHDGIKSSANSPLSCSTDRSHAIPVPGHNEFEFERTVRELDNQHGLWSCNVCVRLPCTCYASTPKKSANPVTPFRQSDPSPWVLPLSPIEDSCSRKKRMVARVSLCPSPPPPQLDALCRQDSAQNLKPATNPIVDETIRMTQDESNLVAKFMEAQRVGLMANSSIDLSLIDLPHVVLCVDSTNGPSVRYDKESYLPKCILQQTHNFNEDNLGTFDDFRAVLVGRGCKMSIVTDKWLANHLRWITWTLASFERRFAAFLSRRCLLYSHVVEKLRERHDRENKDNFRSPLRAVLNRDIPSQRLMILCVSQLKPKSSREGTICECAEIELSDGWYATRAIVDLQLTRFIQQERIRVGTKLLISGASLRGFDDGVDPLDSSFDSFDEEKSPALILYANSCRIAKWNAKLGFVSNRFSGVNEGLLRVKSTRDLLQKGGRVPLMDLVVLRRDPLMFLHKQDDSLVRVLSEQEESERIRISEALKLDIVDELSESFREQCLKVSFLNRTELLKDSN
ncbi:breast cancer 2 susceptibility protein [Fistulifera solaris]|uniref:Breast cancer 2 susceptibility protein n=1 Tax=Fistulifera solaris TaxID=1519565 RepID=A0A1Z5KR93_FISSO|nr:breast cancer 2 susceptibility protein [Fistulifera solaris]|eukprot:GAX28826.1 breast cancer 2 susceptibility protein [Fistulifera solaris]